MADQLDGNDRRQFYAVAKILTLDATGYNWLNKSDALAGHGGGRHEGTVKGWGVSFRTGLPELRATPRLQLKARRKLLDFYGYGPFFISPAAKRLLCDLDSEALEVVECETIDAKGGPIEPYWMMAVKRLVQSFDEGRSDFKTWAETYPDADDAAINPTIFLKRLVMPPNFPTDRHIFQLARFRTNFIVDGAVYEAWRAERLTGAHFLPL
jgi:hypothetical protein